MAESFLVLWAQDHVRAVKQDAGKPLQALFGGSHISAPGYTSHGVVPEDLVYVVAVRDGRMYLLARMQVRTILPIREYREKHRPLLGPDAPHHVADCDGCLTEALLGEGTPFQFNRAIPVEILERLQFRNRKGEDRGVKVEDGRFKSATGIQGHVMRLAPDSARDFDDVIRNS
jgi:hypothetical protein